MTATELLIFCVHNEIASPQYERECFGKYAWLLFLMRAGLSQSHPSCSRPMLHAGKASWLMVAWWNCSLNILIWPIYFRDLKGFLCLFWWHTGDIFLVVNFYSLSWHHLELNDRPDQQSCLTLDLETDVSTGLRYVGLFIYLWGLTETTRLEQIHFNS